MSVARAEILAAIRAELRGVTRVPGPTLRTTFEVPQAERLTRFRSVLERVGGHLSVCADPGAAAKRLGAILAAHQVERLLVSDAPALAPLLADLPATIVRLDPTTSRASRLQAEAGLTTAQWGIAETGTLVLEAASERHRLASLLPALHIALLPRACLLGTLGEALARLEAPGKGPRSRTITFVTGPSRTADIELELVVGVHGPKHLHVLYLDLDHG